MLTAFHKAGFLNPYERPRCVASAGEESLGTFTRQERLLAGELLMTIEDCGLLVAFFFFERHLELM